MIKVKKPSGIVMEISDRPEHRELMIQLGWEEVREEVTEEVKEEVTEKPKQVKPAPKKNDKIIKLDKQI